MSLFFSPLRLASPNDPGRERPIESSVRKRLKAARSLLSITKIQLNTDKWALLAVQINFQKSEKKTCHPLKRWIMPSPKRLNLAKTMEKLPKTNRRIKIEFVRLASVASVGFSLLFAANTFAQNPPLGGGPPPGGTGSRPLKPRLSASLSPARIFRRRRRPAQIRWTPTARKTFRSWAS